MFAQWPVHCAVTVPKMHSTPTAQYYANITILALTKNTYTVYLSPSSSSFSSSSPVTLFPSSIALASSWPSSLSLLSAISTKKTLAKLWLIAEMNDMTLWTHTYNFKHTHKTMYISTSKLSSFNIYQHKIYTSNHHIHCSLSNIMNNTFESTKQFHTKTIHLKDKRE